MTASGDEIRLADLPAVLYAAAKRAQRSIATIGRSVGQSRVTTWRMLRGRQPLRLDDAEGLAAALGYEVRVRLVLREEAAETPATAAPSSALPPAAPLAPRDLLAAASRLTAPSSRATGDAKLVGAFVRDLLSRPEGDTLAILAVIRTAVAQYKIPTVADMGRLRDVAADLVRSVFGVPGGLR